MCGIVGAVSARNIVPILVEGLKRLEYRGYDSCGVAVHQDGGLKRARSTSRVAELETQVASDQIEAGTGIAHTRWATHGAPNERNAHPHISRDGLAIVHNVVAAHGGRVLLESSAGEGFRVTLELPVDPSGGPPNRVWCSSSALSSGPMR